MKAIIHIGMPKTGSSSIQEFLRLNRAQIAQRGFRYARFQAQFGSQYEFGVSALTRADTEISDFTAKRVMGLPDMATQQAYTARYLDFLDAKLAQWEEPIFLGSSEHLVPWVRSPKLIESLQSILQPRFPDGVRYLLYIRPQTSFVTSSYSERMRRGEYISLDEHLKIATNLANYNQLVSRWETGVGAENLDVRLMTRDAMIDGDLLTDFCGAIGLDHHGLVRPNLENPSLTKAQIKWRYRLNRFLNPLKANGQPNKFYARACRLIDAATRQQDEKLTLSEAQNEMITKSFAKSNEWLRQSRFPHRDTLF